MTDDYIIIVKKNGTVKSYFNPKSTFPKSQIAKSEIIPLLGSVDAYSYTQNHPEDYEDDEHYLKELNGIVCVLLLLMLRRVSLTEIPFRYVVDLMIRSSRSMARFTRTSTVCHVKCASDHPSQVDRSTPSDDYCRSCGNSTRKYIGNSLAVRDAIYSVR
jgi:hypothetical protein